MGKQEKARNASQRRRERERAATRQKILRAAARLLVTDGLDGFSMRKLADRIGYTATAIYPYFGDRESLLGEVVDLHFIQFRKAFEQIGLQPNPLVRLQHMGMAFVKFGLEHPDCYRLMFLTALHGLPKGTLLERGNPAQDCYAFLLANVTEAMQAGYFREDLQDCEQLAQIFFASVHGVMALHIVKGEDDWVQWSPLQPKAAVMIRAMIRGLVREGVDWEATPAGLPDTAPAGELPAAGPGPTTRRRSGNKRTTVVKNGPLPPEPAVPAAPTSRPSQTRNKGARRDRSSPGERS